MNNNGRTVVTFIVGLGIGVGLGLLFAPLPGDEAREWLAENAEDRVKRLRRQGRRLIYHVQDALDAGEDKVAKVLRSGKDVLDSVASKLN